MRRARVAAVIALIALMGGCLSGGCGSGPTMTPPAPFDPTCEGRAEPYFAGIEKTSAGGEITVRIVSATPAPPANTDDNMWTVQVLDAAGAPMTGATIVAAPYMVDHGHGAPNIIGTETASGSYDLAPLYLKMTGFWQITIRAAPSGSVLESRVVFPFCIPPI
jgi:hypothetical protein